MIALETIAYSLGVMIIVVASFVLFIGGLEYADRRGTPGDDDDDDQDETGTAAGDEGADADRTDPAGTAAR